MTRVAILIDGAFFLQRLKTLKPDIGKHDAVGVKKAVFQLVCGHLAKLNQIQHTKVISAAGTLVQTQEPNWNNILYRCFFYDAKPFKDKDHKPVTKKPVDFSRSPGSAFRERLFSEIRGMPNFALRLGEVRPTPGNFWSIKPTVLKGLLDRSLKVADLRDSDFTPNLRQKAVDMRIGLDIASITLKKQADTIVLVTGDSDFVPAAKLARREGVKVILDPLYQRISPDLLEHIDALYSGLPNPARDVSKSPVNRFYTGLAFDSENGGSDDPPA